MSVCLPESWRGVSVWLDLGRVEHAATVRVNGVLAGTVLWSPWRMALTDLPIGETFELEITVANTLGNMRQSQAFTEMAKRLYKQGCTSPYYKISCPFEKAGLDGGLYGPVCLMADTRAVEK